ncbi:Putative SOS response-associated peptidase YedK [Roseovarius sp. THAF9]|uniref:SOS response-associated peptidase n=1 Tax=Roseovarius sp. THAF9 TaxID=2587847 RepID=UPI001269461B|nr:SOS response-associated peptidase [Roseovarius sp. THAF9]QFT94016.1 Putative SOS response-associated peptidase YedK [Roseovarius sp. THAF9]
MCGRFAVTLPQDAMAQLFAARPVNDLPTVPNYNVCPTNDVHVVTSDSADRQLGSMRWGFIPHWYKTPADGPLLINARAETIAEKPAFRSAARNRRCLIPASGFYEWTKDEDGNRLPWFIHPAEGDALAFAGIYQSWDKGDAPMTTCAIVTTGANEPMGKIHHRMPVILAETDWPLWLGEAGHGAATLMTAAPDDALRFYRVDPKVNSNRASGPDLIEPLGN